MPKVLVLGVFAALALAGCDAAEEGAPPDGPVGFTRVDLPASPVFVDGTTVICSDFQLASFARREDGSTAPVPDVDFDRQLVVGVFYGGSFHGGCSGDVEVIESVRVDGGALVVEVGPLPDLGPCRAIVYPADMVVVDAQVPAVRFAGDVPR